jgi:P27 family predicted phage terminase small subunit
MTTGRKRTPSALKLVTGNKDKRFNNENEPVVAPAEPSPPDFLSNDAKIEWAAQCPALFAAGIMTELDRIPFAAYCQMFGVWAQAERAIKLMGGALTIQAGNGTTIPNPLLNIANAAMKDMVRYAAEFGITPASRTKVNAVPPTNKNNLRLFSKYFDR